MQRAHYLNLRSANPPHGRQLILHQQVIRLIVKAPLAYDQVGACVLYHLDHVFELFPFVIPEFLVLLDTRDVQFVLCLWTGWFERAS